MPIKRYILEFGPVGSYTAIPQKATALFKDLVRCFLSTARLYGKMLSNKSAGVVVV